MGLLAKLGSDGVRIHSHALLELIAQLVAIRNEKGLLDLMSLNLLGALQLEHSLGDFEVDLLCRVFQRHRDD